MNPKMPPNFGIRVQRGAGAQGGVGFGLVRLVVAADVHGLALDGQEFADDFCFVGGELLGDGLEGGSSFGVCGASQQFGIKLVVWLY